MAEELFGKFMIIGEVGLNHLGNEDYANEYIDFHLNNEFDCLSFQIRESEFYQREEKKHLRLEELFYEKTVNKYCNFKNKKIGLSVSNLDSIKNIINLKFDFYKILSIAAKDTNLIDTLLKKHLGWHFDGQSERHNEYLKASNRKFFRVGIYLQDNNSEYGGGIDILNCDLFKKLPLKTVSRIEKKIIEFYSLFFSKTIHSKKGSVVFFDSRLPHKGTFPKKNPQDVNFRDKYTIYFQVGNKEHCTYFLNNSVERMFKNFKNVSARNYFLDYLKLSFPNEYPSDFVNILNLNNINLLTPSEEQSKFYKEFEKFCEILK